MSGTDAVFSINKNDGTPEWRCGRNLVQLSFGRVRVYRVSGDDADFQEMPPSEVRAIAAHSGHDPVLLDIVEQARAYLQTHSELA